MSLADLLSSKPLASDEDDDGDAPMQSQSQSQSEAEAESEGEGINLMDNDNTGEEDSSDEGEDDSEEERRVRKGFIVDEDESTSTSKKKRRSKSSKSGKSKRSKRSKEGAEGGSSSRKRRSRESDDDAGDLDEDDLALLEENTGVKITGRSKSSSHKLKRLRRRRSASHSGSGSGSGSEKEDLTNIFDEERRGGAEVEYDDEGEMTFADEMAGFIEDDTQSDSSTGGRGARAGSGSDSDRDRNRRSKPSKSKSKSKPKSRGKGRRGAGFGASFVEGITAEAWQEVTDVFGNGGEYAFALEVDEGEEGEGGKGGKGRELGDIFEPSEIASRMLTAADDAIRATDIPERFQLSSVGLLRPSEILPKPKKDKVRPRREVKLDEEGNPLPAEADAEDDLDNEDGEDEEDQPGAVKPFIDPSDLAAAAAWMSPQISARATAEFVLRSASGQLPRLHDEFLRAVQDVVRFLNVEMLEVPFVWMNRGDYLVHRGGPGKKKQKGEADKVKGEGGEQNPEDAEEEDEDEEEEDKAFLDQEECWRIQQLSIKWRALAMRKAELRKVFQGLEVRDEYFEDLFEAAQDVQEVADLSEWLSMRYSRRLAELKEEKAREEEAQLAAEAAEQDGAVPESTRRRQKRVTRESAYEVAKRNVVSQLAEAIGISATDLAKALVTRMKPDPSEHRATDPLTLAEGYSGDGSDYPTADAALAAAKMIAVHEISRDPQLKREARRYFTDYGVVSVVPTEKGQQKIDEMNPFYVFKYLKNKPLESFRRSAQFLQILTAEKDGLVEVSIDLPEDATDKFVHELTEIYTATSGDAGEQSSVAEAWVELRSEIVQAAVQGHLIPAAQTWARNHTQEEEEEFVGATCRQKLYNRINVAPFRRADGTMEKGDVPTVLALSHGSGDPKRDDVVGVFLDADGHFREHVKISNLYAPSEQERTDLVELLRRRRPQVTVIGGYSPNTKRLMADFRSFAQGVTDIIVNEREDQPADDSDEPRLSAEELTSRATFESIYVYDEVARLYSNSQRAALEFPDLGKLGKYCVGLARYAQSPLNEYAALGSDITALNYDLNQKFLSPQKLLTHLERALIEVVNRLGVDINKATRNSYYYHLLPYVSGLGPRKADGLVKKMNAAIGGTLANRAGLIVHNLMTKNVFINAAGFLRIPQDDLQADLRRSNEETEQPEILDDTRIHPEDYDIARKMAADAMEMDEEETEQYKVKSQAVIDLMEEDTGKLDDLSLNDFADELRKLNYNKRLTLYAIRDELQHPYAEPRPDFYPPSSLELFTMLSGETRDTLDRGLIIPVRVLRMRNDGVVLVRLDSGLEGTVAVGYRQDSDMQDSYRAPPPGTTLQAQVIELHLETFEIELSLQQSIISAGDKERRAVYHDQYWDHAQAEAEKMAQSAVERKTAGRQKRIIKHPNFQNIDSGKAEEYLSHMQRGDCVIRPSSKEDHLAVTWKVADGIYQHIAVHELNKLNEFSVGSTLRIAGIKQPYNYSDFDELIVSHIKQMALKVNEMTSHEKFKGTAQELEKWIGNALMANPDRSFYGFGYDPDRKKAGQFVLAFRAGMNAEIQYWPIKVVPGAFVLLNDEHGGITELCNAFKTAYIARTSLNPAMLPSGRTPAYAGGRTPAYPGGGRTPMPGGGRTPAPNPNRMPTPNPYRAGGGVTPRPPSGMTPRPPSGTTPRPAGGMTPAYGADPRAQGGPMSTYNAGYGQGAPPPQQGGWQQQQPWGQPQPQAGYGAGSGANGQYGGGQR